MHSGRAAVFIGNSIFGDDKIGLLIGEALSPELVRSGVDVRIMERTGFALLDCLEGYGRAVVVDSFCDGESPVGMVASFSVDDFSAVKPATPHFSGVPEAAKLMRDLGLEVPDISIIGINVRNPYSLSTDVDTELDAMKDAIATEVYSIILAHLGEGG
jgi:hydrogenase maturation protease